MRSGGFFVDLWVQRLKREAEERNPNEFHFSMEHERTKFGIPIRWTCYGWIYARLICMQL